MPDDVIKKPTGPPVVVVDDPKDQDPKKVTDPKVKTYTEEELQGLVNNKAEILGENKKLKAKLQKIEDDETKTKKDKLEKDGEFKKLHDLQVAENAKLLDRITQNEKKGNLEKQVGAKGFNLAYVSLLDSVVEYNESNEVTNLEKVIEHAKTNFPAAFIKDGKPVLTTDLPPKGYEPERIFTPKEIGEMSNEDFSKHEKEIDRQASEGLIK